MVSFLCLIMALFPSRALADTRQIGKLTREQFALAMHLIQQKVSKGIDPPQTLTADMMPPSERGTPIPVSPTHINNTFLLIGNSLGYLYMCCTCVALWDNYQPLTAYSRNQSNDFLWGRRVKMYSVKMDDLILHTSNMICCVTSRNICGTCIVYSNGLATYLAL